MRRVNSPPDCVVKDELVAAREMQRTVTLIEVVFGKVLTEENKGVLYEVELARIRGEPARELWTCL